MQEKCKRPTTHHTITNAFYNNHIEYLRLLHSGELRHYEGTFIAIVDGNLVDNDLKMDAVVARVTEQFQTQLIYVKKIRRPDETEPVIDGPSIEDKV